MAAGKNKLLRWCRLYYGAYDLSGDARTFSQVMNSFDGVDMTAWSNVVKKYLNNQQRDVGIIGFQALMNDTANSGAFSALKAPYTSPTQVTLAFGGLAEPTNGDPVYFLDSAQMADNADLDGEAHVISADFRADPDTYSGYNPFGKILQGAVSLSASGDSASIDNGASSANGYHAILHIIASDGGTWVLEVEHSTDDAAWAQLALFTADGSVITSEYKTATGTVNRYVQFTFTRTSGTITAVCAFGRG